MTDAEKQIREQVEKALPDFWGRNLDYCREAVVALMLAQQRMNPNSVCAPTPSYVTESEGENLK